MSARRGLSDTNVLNDKHEANQRFTYLYGAVEETVVLARSIE